jgi:proton-translocating NADH-quinone oxidoreductase chain N
MDEVRVVLPLAFLAAGAVVAYLVARFVAVRNRLLAAIAAIAFGAALSALISTRALLAKGQLLSWRSLQAEPGAVAIGGVALGLGLLVALYSGRYIALDRRYELYYPLLMLMAAGLLGVCMAADLFTLYLFCELMSASAYVLVAFRRRTRTAIEAGLKYLVMGSAGTAIMLAGIGFIFRETGHLDLSRASVAPGPWALAGLACLLTGLGLKSAVVPLHTWLPDAHGRAPSSISAMLSGVVIQSAFYAMVKACLACGLPARSLGTVLMGLSLANMTVGNAMALVQDHTKRLLAYSTIAQMGYLMLSVGIGLRYGLPSAIQTGLFLVAAQAAMKGLSFLCKGACHFYLDATTIDELRGTAARMPLVATTFTVALAGLAGVPPLAGFTGKWLILTDIVRTDDVLGFIALGVLLVNSLLALGYYLPLIGRLFSQPGVVPEGGRSLERVRISGWIGAPLVVLAVLVLAIALQPGPYMEWSAGSGAYLLSLGQ